MLKDDIKRRSYIWNTVSGMINAGQSALILIFISHFYSVEEVGVFSIGYAISLLGMTLAKYGQRNYQVTDVGEEYSFPEYLLSRWVTIILTVIFLTVYILIQWGTGKYGIEKALAVFLICLWKQIDAAEDVYYGMYQQRGRLDIGAKRYSERLIFSTVLFCILTLFRIGFVYLVLIVAVSSCAVAVFLVRKDREEESLRLDDRDCAPGHMKRLLIACLSLCISSTLAVYVGNLPKYFIDFYLEDVIQAKFGYLIMPAFMIMVLSMVVFQPIIREMGEAVQGNDHKRLSVYVRRQFVYIGLITGVILAGGAFLGIPVLNLLYHADLNEFWTEFMILLAGGGFYAVSQFLIVPIVSMRKQNDIAVIYIITAAISVIVGMFCVPGFGMRGAAVLYLAINVLLSLFLMLDYLMRIGQMRRRMRNES